MGMFRRISPAETFRKPPGAPERGTLCAERLESLPPHMTQGASIMEWRNAPTHSYCNGVLRITER